MATTQRRRRSGTPRQRCHHCGSTSLTNTAWQDLLPRVSGIDAILMYDGAKPIPRTLTFCGSCGEWLASSIEAQQVEELLAAIRLVVSSSAVADAQLESADRPDIRLHIGGKVYGLEVTAIVRGGDDALKRARWRRAVMRSARLLRRSRSLPPVWVSVRWNGDTPPGRVDEVAALFVDEVEGHLATHPLAAIHAWTNIEPWELSADAARYVHGFHVLLTREDDQWVAGYTVLPPVPPSELQEVITGKGAVLSGYTPHSEMWLLVFAEAGDAAQDLELTAEAKAEPYATDFDRALFLSSMNRVSDLRLS